MDYQKKKLLTQSVAFLQSHLTLSADFLSSLKAAGILTSEEVSTVQKDETTSGKVLELLCLLKRKDNRTYSRFIQVLDERECTSVAQLLKTKGAIPENDGDPRTVHYLQNYLGDTSINSRTMHDMACNLVLRQIHQDETTKLKDKLATLQRQIKATSQLASSSTASLSDNSSDRAVSRLESPVDSSGASCTGYNADGNATPKWDASSQAEEFESILCKKDDLLRRREDEYKKLKILLTETQNDLQSVLDLNSQYLNIIGQMNQMQMNAAATPRLQDKSDTMLDMERQLEQYQLEIKQLEGEIHSISQELQEKGTELQKVVKRERKYKEMLNLSPEASMEDVEKKIRQILEEGTMRKVEADKIKRELMKVMGNRGILEERLTSLNREKEKIEFHMRQQDLSMKKMNRMKLANNTIKNAEAALASYGFDKSQHMRLPSIERPPSQLSLASSKSSRPNAQQYCIFCRQEYMPLKAQHCRIHFRPIRNGKWTCCRDDCHRGAGCLQIPHFYVEITADKKVFLTDGARYMELT